MSRAFTSERDDAPEPPIVLGRTRASRVTPAGHARLRAAFEAAADPAQRARLGEQLDAAVVVPPPDDPRVAAIGAHVTVRDPAAAERVYTIVGELEANPAAGAVAVDSPLARALEGAREGERVVWHRPAGDLALTVVSVRYDGPA